MISGEANARLIAAAPDLKEQRDELLEALEGMLNEYGCIEECGKENFDVPHGSWCEKVQAAIAKAKGGPNGRAG